MLAHVDSLNWVGCVRVSLSLSLSYSFRISVTLSSQEASRAGCGPLGPWFHCPSRVLCHSVPSSLGTGSQAREKPGAAQGMSLPDPAQEVPP